MTLLVFLNELSYRNSHPTESAGRAAVDEFVDVMIAVKRLRGDTTLISESGFFDVDFGGGFSVRSWAADARNKDRMRFVRSLRQRAPFQSVIPYGKSDLIEYKYCGQQSSGLGAAVLLKGLGVSLALAEEWATDAVKLLQFTLVELDNGDIGTIEEIVSVPHAAAAHHVESHQDWLRRAGYGHLQDGSDLWSGRGDFFPHLVLLPAVEQQIASIDRSWFTPLKERLLELELTAAQWIPSAGVSPMWRSKVTPESERRKDLCWFTDIDGERRLFEWHARMTPGAGRIYFRLDYTAGRFVVAYVGHKLE